jgi:hypothetical protein
MRRWWYVALSVVGIVTIRVSSTPLEVVSFMRAPGEREWFTLAGNYVT